MEEILEFIDKLKADSGADDVMIFKYGKQDMRIRLSKDDHHTEIVYNKNMEHGHERQLLIDGFKNYLNIQSIGND